VLAAIDLAAQRRALKENIFQAKAKAFFRHVLARRQFQPGLLDPARLLQRRLHAQCTFCASSTMVDGSLKGHLTPRNRRRSGVTSLRASIASHMALLIMLVGRYSSELTLAAYKAARSSGLGGGVFWPLPPRLGETWPLSAVQAQ
jgi:hypothetical protein